MGEIREHCFSQFTRGNRIAVEQTTEFKNEEVFAKPATAIDWLKDLVCQFEPTLRFGWLIPAYESVEVSTEIHHINRYWNVIPAPIESRRRNVLEYIRHRPYPDRISSHDWLESEPPTHHHDEVARDEYHRFIASEAAWYMDWRRG